jgi:hypothetical protein
VGKASEDALVIKAAIADDLDKISDLRALFETFPDVIRRKASAGEPVASCRS